MDEIAEKMQERGGIDHVYCLACGGSLASCFPLEYVIRNESAAIKASSISANEFVHVTPKNVGPRTLAVAMSLAGGTPETVKAARVAKEKGATVIVLCAKDEAPLRKYGDYVINYGDELKHEFADVNQSKLLQVGFELLRIYDNYPYYDKAMDGFDKIQGICDSAVQKLKSRAAAFGIAHRDEPIIYTLGSGPNTMISYMQCICMFMEMEWIHSSSIHTGEFFHGPFEITDPDTPFMIFMGEGRSRALDERALKFLRTYGKKITIVDLKELGINKIFDEVVEFFNPILAWCAALEYAKGIAEAKQHPLLMRRYMYKVEY